MKKIEIQSNRKCLIFIPLFVLALNVIAIIILTCAFLSFRHEKYALEAFLFGLFFFAGGGIILVVVALIIKYHKGRRYVFSEEAIEVYDKNVLVETIKVSDLTKIAFYPFRLRYIVTIFSGELSEGGCWKLHCYTSDGKRELAFFALSDVKKLKELYGDLIVIK